MAIKEKKNKPKNHMRQMELAGEGPEKERK